MWPDVRDFLARCRAAGGAIQVDDIKCKLDKKKKEHEVQTVQAKGIAKDLNKLRNQEAKVATKTKGAATEDLLQALADRADQAAKNELEEQANRELEAGR